MLRCSLYSKPVQAAYACATYALYGQARLEPRVVDSRLLRRRKAPLEPVVVRHLYMYICTCLALQNRAAARHVPSTVNMYICVCACICMYM